MIPSNQRYPIRIPNLQTQQQQKALQTVEAAVDKVAQEQVIRARDVAADPEQLHQVVELPVDVAADGGGRVHNLHVALFNQQLARFVAQLPHLRFRDRFARAEECDGSAIER